MLSEGVTSTAVAVGAPGGVVAGSGVMRGKGVVAAGAKRSGVGVCAGVAAGGTGVPVVCGTAGLGLAAKGGVAKGDVMGEAAGLDELPSAGTPGEPPRFGFGFRDGSCGNGCG
ncbi:MAG: hypothetical protein H0X73_05280 [Chthoniobacterales bacterium]|nr:hypothetical protein [Chthoniobacterales bacterium]